jgi:hypothetical protein
MARMTFVMKMFLFLIPKQKRFEYAPKPWESVALMYIF